MRTAVSTSGRPKILMKAIAGTKLRALEQLADKVPIRKIQ